MYIHGKLNKHKCGLCGKRFVNEEKLKIHMNYVHNKEEFEKHKCNQCDRSHINETGQGVKNEKCRRTKCITCNYLGTGKLYGSFVHKRALVIYQFQSVVMLYFTIFNFKM